MSNLPEKGIPAAPPAALWAGALSLLLRHNETACPKSARQAAELLGRLADDPALDRETRALCARASDRLGDGRHFDGQA
jgi:hypothetical protein